MGWFNSIFSLFGERVVYRSSSQFNPTLEVVENGGHLRLDASHVNYSFGGLHKAFQQLFIKLDISKTAPGSLLILGFGAGSIASIIQNEYELNCSITGVEIDPEVIALGRRFFGTGDFSDLTIVEDDAFLFMEKNTAKFDLVVVDLYLDLDVPAAAETHEFATQLRNALSENGRLVFNKYVYDKISMLSAGELRKSLNNTFGNVNTYKTGHNKMNNMFVCIK
jgi:spermidine synthase